MMAQRQSAQKLSFQPGLLIQTSHSKHYCQYKCRCDCIPQCELFTYYVGVATVGVAIGHVFSNLHSVMLFSL